MALISDFSQLGAIEEQFITAIRTGSTIDRAATWCRIDPRSLDEWRDLGEVVAGMAPKTRSAAEKALLAFCEELDQSLAAVAVQMQTIVFQCATKGGEQSKLRAATWYLNELDRQSARAIELAAMRASSVR